jgi:hypothetical protein
MATTPAPVLFPFIPVPPASSEQVSPFPIPVPKGDDDETAASPIPQKANPVMISPILYETGQLTPGLPVYVCPMSQCRLLFSVADESVLQCTMCGYRPPSRKHKAKYQMRRDDE